MWILLLLSTLCRADDQPVIEAISADSPSDRIVVIQTTLGNRVGVRGTVLKTGEHVKTGPRASARILYPDGSKLLVGKGSEIVVAGNSQGTEWTNLESGEVRGVVKKTSQASANSALPAARHRFAIRSKSAVMGVRGTDFFFSLDEAVGDARVVTLEGTVEVAKTEGELSVGQGVSVPKGQYVTAGAKGVDLPRAFDTDEYLKQIQRESPEMLKVSDPGQSTHSRGDPGATDPALDPTGLQEPKVGDIRPLIADPSAKPLTPLERKVARFRPWTFQLAGVDVRQKKGAETKTVLPSWNPVFDLPIPLITLAIRGHFGIMPLKSRTSQSQDARFFGWETGLLVSLMPPILPLIVELGVGRSGWTSGHSEPGALFLANVAVKLSRFGFLERLFVGVSHFDKPNPGNNSREFRDPATNFKAGIGVQF